MQLCEDCYNGEYYGELRVKVYAPRYYYKRDENPDEYSKKIYFSKDENKFNYFLSQFSQGLEEVMKLEESKFDLITVTKEPTWPSNLYHSRSSCFLGLEAIRDSVPERF